MSSRGLWRDQITLPRLGDLWVFAYGSLLWKPGFEPEDREPARLEGYHRRFCVLSRIYRGTPQLPGLVLGLAAGGDCHGLALRIGRARLEETLDYLWDREMQTGIYFARQLSLVLGREGRTGTALAFVVNPDHEQFCGSLDDDAAADRIVTASGTCGSNLDYFLNTIELLNEHGLPDPGLGALCASVDARLRARPAA